MNATRRDVAWADAPCETDAEDMVLVVPEGLKHTWNARHCCQPAIKNGYDDVGFMCAIKRHLAAWWGEMRVRVFRCVNTPPHVKTSYAQFLERCLT